MAVRTGATAQLGFSATGTGTYTTIAKVRDVTLDINRDALETTGIGEKDRTYAYGIRGTSGSGTLLYDPEDTGTAAIINQILDETEALSTIQLQLDTGSTAGTIAGPVLITATGTSVSVGDLVTVPISFTISGKPTGLF
jgi:predicted secreted protein